MSSDYVTSYGGFGRRTTNTGDDYLSFEARYTAQAAEMFDATKGIEREVWREVVLSMRKEARDLWTRAGGSVPPKIHFGGVQ